MNDLKQRGIYIFLTLTLLLSVSIPASAAVTQETLTSAVSESAQFMYTTVEAPQSGSAGGEWAIIGLARSGYDVPQEYWDTYYAAVEQQVTDCRGVLHNRKYTEYSRLTVALTAIGANPADVAGYNLLTPLGDFDRTIWQGINGPIWALIALDSGNYDVPVNAQAATQANRQMYVDEILSRQLADGGWSLTGTGGGAGPSDADITGMALQALANYREQPQVKQAIDGALACMSTQQQADGGYARAGVSSSESCVQMLVALCTLDIDLEDSRFVKNDNTLLDCLLRYQNSDGSFIHTKDSSGENQFASEQGLYGLVAAMRQSNGMASLYHMTDVTITTGKKSSNAIGLPRKHRDVANMPVTAPGTTFTDVANHANRAAIDAMASRGILGGRAANAFAPDTNMTRAEFATVMVRALGLTPAATDAFSDVSSDAWYAPYIGTAAGYGLISGVGGGRFNPEGTITRQEAAVMVAGAAQLCGLDTALNEDEIRNDLAQFGDYITIDDWAKPGVAFCYRENILDQSDLTVEPTTFVSRCEVAQMLYHLLDAANLL